MLFKIASIPVAVPFTDIVDNLYDKLSHIPRIDFPAVLTGPVKLLAASLLQVPNPDTVYEELVQRAVTEGDHLDNLLIFLNQPTSRYPETFLKIRTQLCDKLINHPKFKKLVRAGLKQLHSQTAADKAKILNEGGRIYDDSPLRCLVVIQRGSHLELVLETLIREQLKEADIPLVQIHPKLSHYFKFWDPHLLNRDTMKKDVLQFAKFPSKETLTTALETLLKLPAHQKLNYTSFKWMISYLLNHLDSYTDTEKTQTLGLFKQACENKFSCKDIDRETMEKEWTVTQACVYGSYKADQGPGHGNFLYFAYCCRVELSSFEELRQIVNTLLAPLSADRLNAASTKLLDPLVAPFIEKTKQEDPESHRYFTLTRDQRIGEQVPKTPQRQLHTLHPQTPRTRRKMPSPQRFKPPKREASPRYQEVIEKKRYVDSIDIDAAKQGLYDDKEILDMLETRDLLWKAAKLKEGFEEKSEEEKGKVLRDRLRSITSRQPALGEQSNESVLQKELISHCLALTEICHCFEDRLADIKKEQAAMKAEQEQMKAALAKQQAEQERIQKKLEDLETTCTTLHNDLVDHSSSPQPYLTHEAIVEQFTEWFSKEFSAREGNMVQKVKEEIEASQTLDTLDIDSMGFCHDEIGRSFLAVYQEFFILLQSKMLTQFVVRGNDLKIATKGRYKVAETAIAVIPDCLQGVEMLKSIGSLITDHAQEGHTQDQAEAITASIKSVYSIPMIAKKLTETLFNTEAFQEAFESYYLSLSSKKRTQPKAIAQKLFRRYKRKFPIASEINAIQYQKTYTADYSRVVPTPSCFSYCRRGPQLSKGTQPGGSTNTQPPLAKRDAGSEQGQLMDTPYNGHRLPTVVQKAWWSSFGSPHRDQENEADALPDHLD